MEPPLLYLILVAIGVVTGALAGLTGASGMSVLISGLMLAGFEIRQVIGLTFVVTLANAVAAIGAFWRNGNVDVRTTLVVAAPAVVGVWLGHDFSGGVSSDLLTIVMITCLFGIGARFVAAKPDAEEKQADESTRSHGLFRSVCLFIVGGMIGVAMGLMGGGGALFISVGLILLLRFPTKTAIGTSVAIMGLAAVPGVFAHSHDGTIHFGHAAVMLCVSMPTALLASRYANRIPNHRIKRLLGVYLLTISMFLIARQGFAYVNQQSQIQHHQRVFAHHSFDPGPL